MKQAEHMGEARSAQGLNVENTQGDTQPDVIGPSPGLVLPFATPTELVKFGAGLHSGGK